MATAGQPIRGHAGTSPQAPAGADDQIAALLEDRECPGRRRRGTREIEVDRFLAFAYSRGCPLAGLERRADRVVRALGGDRIEPAPSVAGEPARRLPVYVLSD